ncbi:MAG TPA: mechanosensitive ion channel, partial [Armatimonadota bacterium]|nr:mechanosensitive ion channel [Armatimonadota bacterium]
EPNLIVAAAARLVVVLFIFGGARVLVGMMRRIVTRGLASIEGDSRGSARRVATLHGLLTSALSYLVYFVAIILTLFVVGVTWKGLAPLLGAASVLGLAIGFGAQKLVRDVITGLFILGEGQFDVGDWVTIGAVTGRVAEIGLRVTRIIDEQGRLYVIANGDISQVFNASRGPVKQALEFTLARAGAVEEAAALVRRAAEEALAALGLPPGEGDAAPSVLVTNVTAAAVTLRLTVWVPVRARDAVEDTLRRRLAQAIEAAGLAAS